MVDSPYAGSLTFGFKNSQELAFRRQKFNKKKGFSSAKSRRIFIFVSLIQQLH